MIEDGEARAVGEEEAPVVEPAGTEPGPAREPPGGVRRILLGALLVAQIALMTAAFNPSPHSGGDNAGYLNLAYSLVTRGQYLDLHDPVEPGHTKYPPVFPAVLAGAMLLGARSWTAFKALSAFFTTLGIVLAFAWVEERRGPFFALGVGLILAFSDAFLWSSHWILSDPLFVALTLLAVWALERWDAEGETGMAAGGWLVLGTGAVLAAYFTRSAGLPLVVAVIAWLALRRRWKAAGGFSVAFLVPAALWWLRGRGISGGAYLSEFLLVNPYQPELGRAGPADFLARFLENVARYVATDIPGGLTGLAGGVVTALGVVLVVTAAGGWLLRVGRRISAAELFVPLYLGLILLWPTVWSGDRLALPLYPFLLFYAGDLLVQLAKRMGARAVPALGVAAVLVFVAPAAWVWWDNARTAQLCRVIVASTGPFGCYGNRLREFVSAARWGGENLPEDAVVMSRKPRLFFTMTGLKGLTYPLEDDADAFFRVAEEAGARYVVVDYIDNLSRYYLVPVISARAGAFCSLASWGDPADVRTELLGILAPEEREPLEVGEDDEGALVMDLRVCPADMVRPGAWSLPGYRSLEVPLLSRLDRRESSGAQPSSGPSP